MYVAFSHNDYHSPVWYAAAAAKVVVALVKVKILDKSRELCSAFKYFHPIEFFW